MMKTYPKGSDILVSKYFHAREFDCPCTNPECTETHIDDVMLSQADAMRDELGCPVIITSGNRCKAYQADLKARGFETAAGPSQHEEFHAFDCRTGKHTGDQLEQVARRHGFFAVGVGKTFVHCDMRNDKMRRWVYSY